MKTERFRASNRLTIRGIVLVSLTLWTLVAVSSPAGAAKLFVGGSLGQADVASSFSDPDFGNVDVSGSDFAYRLFAGLRFGIIGAEAGFRDFGNVAESTESGRFRTDTDGVDAFATANFSLGPVHLFAKGGVIFWNTTVGLEGFQFDSSGTDLAWGLGVAYQKERFGFRLEYEAFDVSNPDDLATISLGVTFDLLG